MEASFVLKAALEHKIPFTSVKVIFDDKKFNTKFFNKFN